MRISQPLRCYIQNKTFEITIDKCTIIVKPHNNSTDQCHNMNKIIPLPKPPLLSIYAFNLIIKKQTKKRQQNKTKNNNTTVLINDLSMFTPHLNRLSHLQLCAGRHNHYVLVLFFFSKRKLLTFWAKTLTEKDILT